MSSAALFPGQGSPPRDMRERVERELPELAELLYHEVGDDVFDAPEQSQRRVQPALFAAIMAGWNRLQKLVSAGVPVWGEGVAEPAAYAGHSLGEIPALVAAGALDLADAVHFVHVRGTIMEEALAGPARGAMASIIDPDAHGIARRAAAEREDLYVCADNSAVQAMVSGPEAAVERFVADATDRGLRVVLMPMRGAGHSPLMASCVGPYREALAAVEFRSPRAPVWSCATGAVFGDPRSELADGVVGPVRFREVLLGLHQADVRRFVDVGPGHVLAGLAYKTLPGVETLSVPDLEATAAPRAPADA